MKKVLAAATGLAFAATGAHAGGLDRSGQDIGILFEKGNLVELSFGAVAPKVSGSALGGMVTTGDVAPDYTQIGFGIKQSYSDKIDLAVTYDQPFGAAADYSGASAAALKPTKANVGSNAVTGLVKFNVGNGMGVYGGLRLQQVTGSLSKMTGTGLYSLDSRSNTGVGYVLGVSYEKPEIALRVSLTYNSKIKHTMSSTEKMGAATISTTPYALTSPESVNLDFQTGVAANTLVFGSVRWVNWKGFEIKPAAGGSVLSYTDDTFAYTLGVGRKINDQLSLAASVGWENGNSDKPGLLGPTYGSKSLSLAAIYTMDNTKITAGVRYVKLGDAIGVPVTGIPGGIDFKGNSALGVGISISHSF